MKTPLMVVTYIPKGGGRPREHTRLRLDTPESVIAGILQPIGALADIDPDEIIFTLKRPVEEGC